MYSIVEIKGHQYRVAPGDVIDVDRLETEVGKVAEFDKVLFVGGNTPVVGSPTVNGAKVKAQVVKTDRDRKILVFKRKPGSYRRKKGHRQWFTCLVITEVNDGKGQVAKIDTASKTAQKYNIK